jgi:PAS domain S-box-containing protein
MYPSPLSRKKVLSKGQPVDPYRSIFENAIEGIFQTTPSGQYLNVNPALAKMYGYDSPSELIQSLTRIDNQLYVNPSRREDFVQVMKAHGVVRGFESEIYRKDGSIIWISENARAVLDEAGAIIYYEGMVEDITERKRLEDQIAEQAALLDKAQDAIMVCGLDGVIQFWNKGAEVIYGWSRDEAMGQNVGQLLYAKPGKFEDANRQVLNQGEWFGEIQHQTKARHELNIQARWTLVRDKEGRPKSILAINTDITEKKKIEAQFMRAQRMEGIGTLAGGIAHDLNNILTPIMMSIEMLKAISTDHRTRGILETIEVSSKRGADIVRQVLSFARGVEGERIEVRPRNLVKDIQALLKNTFPKNIRMDIAIPNGCWAVLGDPTQLHQVLLNLSINARDAMPNGGTLTITAENVVVDQQYAGMDVETKMGRYVVMNVTDSGLGIPPEIIDKIFDPFFTTKEVGKGTGLGLSSVVAIVKSHEGFLNVYSEPGRGTTFKVYLPALDISSDTEKQLSGKLFSLRGNGEMVLLVDDELSILNITSQTLQTFGYRVLTATDGAKALAAYMENQNDIAVVLTDMSMPIMDGAAFIRTLIRFDPAIKIIAASGLDADGGVINVSTFGAKHFLTKPYTAGTLLKTLRAVLDAA